MKVKSVIAATALMFVGVLSHAAPYDIDTAHSQVAFKVRHLVAKTSGQFDKFKGTVEFDEAKPELMVIQSVIETGSVNTSNADRDKHLKSPDFFNVEKFPTMEFKSTSVKVVSKNSYKVMGNLTLLGVTKPVTLDVDYSGATPDPWGNLRVGFSAKTKINRKDFGMVFNMAMDKGGFVIGDDVEINLEIEGMKKK